MSKGRRVSAGERGSATLRIEARAERKREAGERSQRVGGEPKGAVSATLRIEAWAERRREAERRGQCGTLQVFN